MLLRQLWKASLRELKVTAKVFYQSDLQLLAASLSFYTILSLVPLFAVSFSIFKFVGGFVRIKEDLLPNLVSFLSAGAGETAQAAILNALENVNPGALSFLSFFVFFLISLRLLLRIDGAIQKIWRVQEARRWKLQLLVLSLLLLLGPVGAAVVVGVVLGIEERIQWAALMIPSAAFFSLICLYQFVPKRQVKWKASMISAAVVLVILYVAQKVFLSMATEMFHYNKVYGALAAFPLFLVWLQLLWMIVLSGVTLSYRISLGPKATKSAPA